MTELRDTLNVAARSRQMSGATEAQIDLICRLASESGVEADYMNITTLTKFEASIIIDTLQNPVDLAAIASANSERLAEEALIVEEMKSAIAEYAAQEAAKSAWISANYPDYESRDTKGRKRIRAVANKAIAA